MNKYFHPASGRGYADHDWLRSYHSFSFANYYNPEMMGFGTLRVINDDWIAPGKGFGTHPHRNMEIITIPLTGAVKHEDTLGSSAVVKAGEVQVMSAGRGVAHSEFNVSQSEELTLFQIWVLPNKHNVEPRYDQKEFDETERQNKFQLIVSPDGRDGSLFIHQDAYFSRIDLTPGKKVSYRPYSSRNGLYCLSINENILIQDQPLAPRDALGTDLSTEEILISNDKESTSHASVLLMEVPLSV